MQHAREVPPFARSLLLMMMMAAAACSDLPSSSGAPAPGEPAPSFSAAARAPRDVPAVRIDLPASPRPWDGNPAALQGAIVTASGYAVVAFKETGSGRALANGHRGAVAAGTVRAGLQLLERSGAEVIELLDAIGAARVRVTPAQAVELARHPLVDFVEPRQYGRVQAQETPWGITMVGAPGYWPLNTGAGARVLIIDTGHQQNHVDLPAIASSNCAGEYGGCDDASTAGWHGTRVLGIVAARDNLDGVVGVAPGTTAANIYMYGACDDYAGCPTDGVTAGINAGIWNANVINVSLVTPTYDAAMATAVAQAWSNGIVIVAAAGNFMSNTPVYPAAYTNVVGVSGVNADKSFAASGTTGCSGYSNYGSHVDLSAPFSASSTIGNNGYGTLCGTSMAAPHVTGVAALVKSANPGWTSQQVVDHLFATAEDQGSAGRDDYYGYGIVRAVSPPCANITGPAAITAAGTYTWQANAGCGNGTYTYHWEYRVGTAAWTSVGTSSSYSRTVAAGNPSFELRVTVTSGGLSGSDTHSVGVAFDPLPAANITGTSNVTTAGTYTWQANATGGNGAYTYKWEYRVGTAAWSSVGTSSSYSRTVALGNPAFELRVTVTSNSANASDTHSVAVAPQPTAANITGTSSISSAGTYTWQANASGGNGTYTYNWEYRAGTAAWTSVGTASSYSRTVALANPSFELRVTVTSSGVSGSDTHAVAVVVPPPAANITGTSSITAAGTYTWQANASGGNGAYTYHWEYRVGTAAWTSVGTASSYSRTVSAGSASFELRVTVTSNGSSASDTHTVSVSIASGPTATITGPAYLVGGTTGTWSSNASGGNGTYTYQWQYRLATTGTWTNVATTATYSRRAALYGQPFYVRVTVTSNGLSHTTPDFYVYVEPQEPMCGDVYC